MRYRFGFVAEDESFVPVIQLQTKRAVASDYLWFIQGIAEYLLEDKDLEANILKLRRTTKHDFFNTFGTKELDPE